MTPAKEIMAMEKLAPEPDPSLSEVVETPLQKITDPPEGKSVAKQLRGCAAEGPLSALTYEEIREEYAEYQLKKHHPARRYPG